ncbi:MAG: hypothetical protein IRY93_07000 [Chthoniobacterales bacterium]|jgi:hypothetical protein|nr:hypothetical protein [Chthoniobacterales bacterium]
MKLRVLLCWILAALLCGCAANTPYSETMVDTGANTRERVLPETPVVNRPVYTPGTDGVSSSHW